MFFIKDSQRYLPITQERFDEIFVLIGLPEFKTSGQASWENYLEFININKQVRDFLKTKDPNATLLDAHSFLYILGSQMKEANFKFTSIGEITSPQAKTTPAEELAEEPLIVEELFCC